MPTNIDYDVPWLIIPESWKQSEAKTDEPAAASVKREPAKREPAQWRPMTPLEIEAATQLGLCRLPPATSTKRLARSMAMQAEMNEPKITDRQAEYLWQFCWKFRRQIASEAVVREAKRRNKP